MEKEEGSRWTDQPTIDDQLGFGDYRRTLVEVVRTADTPITVGVFGGWGSGKTSLMRMVQEDLKQAGRCRTAWFDAWKYDRDEVLWRALLLSCVEAFRGRKSEGAEGDAPQGNDQELDDIQASLYRDVDREEAGSLEVDWREAGKGAVKVGLSFLPLVPQFVKVFTKAEAAGPSAEGLENLMKAVRRKRSQIHRDQVQFLEGFQGQFKSLVAKRLPPAERFVVFIDDLDRCLPEKAIEVLEAIKLFLDAERCVFVVGVERRIIERGIRVKYRSFLTDQPGEDMPISGDEYLEKIVQVPFHLPPLEVGNIESFAKQSLEGEAYAESVACVLAQGMEANPRKIKRVLNIFRVLWELARQRQMTEDGTIEADLLAKMVVIQSRWRDDLYADVAEYPNLLENLEERFEQLESAGPPAARVEEELMATHGMAGRKAEVPPEATGRAEEAGGEEAPAGTAKGAERPARLVERYTDPGYRDRKYLRRLLRIPAEKAGRFKGKDLHPYVYLTSTAAGAEAAVAAELDERVWEDLLSDDPTKIQAAVARLPEEERGPCVQRLLEIVRDPRNNDLRRRIAAGNGLGMVGDPRLLEMDMVRIPAGPFLMGTEGGHDDEAPQRTVTLDEYEMARFPLTNVQYKAFLDAVKGHEEPEGWHGRMYPLGRANHPVARISWDDAMAYAAWLSKVTGREHRLPTEAEWEKAARGADGRTYPWEGEFDAEKCNTREGGIGGTTPVGAYPDGASPYGVLDMAGNVWEWCADWYGEDYYRNAPDESPKGPESGEARVVRGGSWLNGRGRARCASRGGDLPEDRYYYVGVRFSRTV
ncbi:MAG: SUMF1/EgtB/PvdO family nonheme iron enzyme [Gemmatimonadota bacterium]